MEQNHLLSQAIYLISTFWISWLSTESVDQKKLLKSQNSDSFVQFKKMLNPKSVFYFNILVCLLILYFFVEIPLVLFFRLEDASIGRTNYLTYFMVASCIVFALEIPIRSRSSKVSGIILIEDPEEVKKSYLGLPIFIDLLGLFAILLRLSPAQNLQYLQLLFFLKVYNLYLYDQSFNWVLGVQSTRLAVYDLIKVAIYLFYFSHISACIFFIIDYTFYLQEGFYYENSYLWLLFEQCMSFLINWPLPVQYQYALYWAIMTSTSVAYGDIYPKNLQQVLFTSVMFFPIFILFSLLMNTVFQTFSKRDQTKLQRYLTRDTIKNMLRKRKTSLKHNYLHQLLYQANKAQQFGDNDSRLILNVLSKQLCQQLSLQIYSQPYSPFTCFSSNFIKLVFQLTEQKFYFRGQSLSLGSNFAYIFTGKLKQFVFGLDKADFQNGRIEICNKTSRSHLNVYGIVTGAQEEFCQYITEETTQIYFLNHKRLLNIVNEKTQSELYNASFNLIVNKNYVKWSLKCKICHESSHVYFQCPIFVIFNKEKNGKESKQRCIQNQRINFQRKNNLRFHKLRNLTHNKTSAQLEKFQETRFWNEDY